MITANTTTDSRTVFLVDDDSSTVDLYSKRLELAGFKTASALDAKQAAEALSNLSPDLIILDLMLPKRSGLELLEAIRADSRHRATPVLLLSNGYLPDITQKALKAGGNKALSRWECTSSELVSASRELAGGNGNGDASDAGVTEQLKSSFLQEVSNELAVMRQQWFRYGEAASSEEGKGLLAKVYQGVRFLSTRAGLAGCGKVAQLSGAIEAMLFEHLLKSDGGMSASSIQTVIQALECLEWLFSSGNTGPAEARKAKVLVVDDDPVCNRINQTALKRANYEPVSESNPIAALIELNKTAFDLILLDINMQPMNGIELCQKLRTIPKHQNTPVIFVTAHGDFLNRAPNLLMGGDDLISKPISALELIVKATVFLLGASRARTPKQVVAASDPQASTHKNGGTETISKSGNPKAEGAVQAGKAVGELATV